MISVKTRIIFLIACLLDSIWLLIAQTTGNSMLLIPCLACFFATACFSAIKGMAIPVFMYFLPFAPLLKLQPGTTSVYTIAMLAVYLIYLFTNGRNISAGNIKLFVAGSLLLVLALVVKTINGYGVASDFIWFFASLLFIPLMIKELNIEYDFYWLTLFFVIGIAFAAITAQYLVVFPPIRQYITLRDIAGALRHSGYYGDPNFYAAHITAALGGVLVLLLNTVKKGRLVFLALCFAALIYCGFLSVSKSFFLTLICLALFWIVDLLTQKGKLSFKIMVALVIGIGVAFLLSSTVFADSIDMMLERFDKDSTMSGFTTGRSVIWDKYLSVFEEVPFLLLFGQGLTSVLVDNKSSHNTILQCVYQFGIVGCVLLSGWIIRYFRQLLVGSRTRKGSFVQVCVLLIGAFGPWMALDLLLFYEFFLIPMYICAGIRFLNGERERADVFQEEIVKN